MLTFSNPKQINNILIQYRVAARPMLEGTRRNSNFPKDSLCRRTVDGGRSLLHVLPLSDRLLIDMTEDGCGSVGVRASE
jgi:hypothetical protein